MNVQTHHPSHAHHANAPFAHPPRNVAALGIEPGMKVADFGSGSGAYALLIAEALRGEGVVYAIDVQGDLLKRLKNETHRRGFDNVEVLWGDVEKSGGTKLAERALDMVLISNLLFQVDDVGALFTEARRVLKRGGRLALIDWSDVSGARTFGPERKRVIGKEKAQEKARAAGFELVHEFDAGAHHYGLIMRAV